MQVRFLRRCAFAAACAFGAAFAADAPMARAETYVQRLPEDEVIYFLLPDRFENGDPVNDRGGLSGGRLRRATIRRARASIMAATSRA